MIAEYEIEDSDKVEVVARKTSLPKCARCWIHHSSVGSFSKHPGVCEKCFRVLEETYDY
ncbi:MAG: hypothetical protein NC913_04205 [Candidatus Omnitrophica bacterium]|nr:hypothetical protein [Candidatus Omnitrophota bacterium]